MLIRTLTLWLCSSKQYPIRRENISLTSGPSSVFCPPHSIQPFSCTIRPSMTPSRIAFPTIYSASSSESKCNLTHMSRSEMREYESERRRMPVLITFCRRRATRVQVLSASKLVACAERVVWNCEREPVRTATTSQAERTTIGNGSSPFTMSKYPRNAFSSTGCRNRLRSGMSPMRSSTTTNSLCTAW